MDTKRRTFPTRLLYKDLPLALTCVTEEERFFLRDWCQTRNLSENYIVVATTYWLRCKGHAYTSFFKFAEAKDVYLVLCIHLTLKHLGYEELYKCNFFADLRELYPRMKPREHREMEWELFRYLNFDLGI